MEKEVVIRSCSLRSLKRIFSVESYMKRILVVFYCLFLMASAAHARTVFTTDGSINDNDPRHEYRIRLLRLSLEKTINKYGPYELVIIKHKATTARVLVNVEQATYENYFTSRSVSKERMEKLLAVPFPVALGIVGYRVAFTSTETKKKLQAVKNLADLKEFSVIQGVGWLDVDILQLNGFEIASGASYEGMFKMVALNRADLFFRGANELMPEWETHKYIENLQYDESIALYYPLPRFYYTAKENKQSAARVYDGLVTAYKDGSLMELWDGYFGKSVAFCKLNDRTILTIPNPFLKGIDPSYEQYLYTPKINQ